MSVSNKHILRQWPVINAMGQVAVKAALQKIKKEPPVPISTPGPEMSTVISPVSLELIKDFARNVGGNPSSYRHETPPHLFPHWSFGLATKTLLDIPYPLVNVMNGGCRIEINHPLPIGQPLYVTARLEGIDDNGRRAVLHQRITTGTSDVPESLVAHLYAIIPLSKKDEGEKPKIPKPRPRVPEKAREIDFLKISSTAGLDFAKLTGDFNPIHWIPAYAKASGFKNTILHGFGSMARVMESLKRVPCADGRKITMLDVQFTRPLVLPAKVRVFIDHQQKVYLGKAPGGPAYLIGTYQTDT